MGSWNSTCAVSHLPIYWRDEVVAVVIRPRIGDAGVKLPNVYHDVLPSLGGGYSSPTSMCMPVPFAIRGRYNSYGMIEDIEKGPHIEVLEHLVKQPVEKFLKEAERVEPEDGRGPPRRGTNCLVMVLPQIWEFMLARSEEPDHVDEILDQGAKYREALPAYAARTRGPDDGGPISEERMALHRAMMDPHEEVKRLLHRGSYDDMGFHTVGGPYPMIDIQQMILDDEMPREALVNIREVVRVTNAMLLLRRGWSPPFNGLGFDDCLGGQRDLAVLIGKMAGGREALSGDDDFIDVGYRVADDAG